MRPHPGLLLSIVLSLTLCVLPRLAGEAKGDPESPEYWRDAQRSLAELGDGYLVWETKRTGTWQIWTMNLDGTGLRQLTPAENDRDQQCPQISPDGTRVAYLSSPVGSGPSGGGQASIVATLHLVNRDGSGGRVIATNATKYGGWNRAVVWFNDHELAYINGADRATYRLNLTTGQSTLLFKSQHGMAWLPNTKLNHVVESFNQISLLDGDKQAVTVVPSLGGCQPYPTADGNWVVWNHGCGGPIAKVNLTTRGVSDLLYPRNMPDGYSFIYFSMVSDNMHLLALAGCRAEHRIGGYAGAEDSWYEIFVAPLDPVSLEVTGKPVRYTFHSKTPNRFPDVWQANPAFGFHGDKAPFTVSLAAKEMTGDWAWDYGDGATERAPIGKHTYVEPGIYVVTAKQDDRVLRGQVHVREAKPPVATGALVENIKELVVSFSEPMDLDRATFSLESGVRIEKTEVAADGRMARLFLAERLRKDDRLQIDGATDRAQKANPLAGGGVRVKASFWPDNPARAAFLWETGNKPNLVRDPFSGEIHSYTTEWRNRAWMDHNHAMVFDGGMCNIVGIRDVWFNDIRQSDHPGQVSFECTITPRNLERDNQLISTIGLKQRKDRLFLDNHELGALKADKPCHVLIASGDGELRVYLDGKEVLKEPKNWTFEGWLCFGGGLNILPWFGTMEGIALYNRVLTADEAKAEYEAYHKLLAAREPVPTVQVVAELIERSCVPTPAQIAPYVKGLSVYEYKVRKVVRGKLDALKIRVAHWTVLDRDPTRVSTLPVGAAMDLALERFEDNPQLEGQQIDDSLPIDDTPLFFAVREARIGHQGVPAWKMLPADMAKGEPIETMADIAADFKPPQGAEWKIGAPDPLLGLLQPYSYGCPGTVYALTYVTSPKDRQAILSLYTASTAKVWLNGQPLLAFAHEEINRYPFPGNKRRPLTLKKGVNQLLVKVTNYCGNYALACDLLDPKGEELTDVKYSVEAR